MSEPGQYEAGQVHLRDGRRRVVARQGARGRLDRRLLEGHGYRVALQKFDPYINVDPGTMSPFQHGEVFVTDDGAETDLDLGPLRAVHQHGARRGTTTGRPARSTCRSSRRNAAATTWARTVQVIPHITNEIKDSIRAVAQDVDIVIVEIGGTVGDIESLPFLEAIRQFRQDVGSDNTIYIHLTLVPCIGTAGELKTKPTQHSVRDLRSIGIQPDILLCRTDRVLAARGEAEDRAVLRRRRGGGHHGRATWTPSTKCRWRSPRRASTGSS